MPLNSTFILSPEAKVDLEYWKSVPAPKTMERIMRLIRDTMETATGGLDDPSR